MVTAARSNVWNLPNGLTLSRLGLAFVAFGLIGYKLYAAAAVVMVLAAITDWLDGWLARRWGLCSSFGRQFDPLVDKLLVSGAYVYLLVPPFEATGLRPWMVTVIICRELIVQALRSAIEGRGVAFGAKWAGKVKTTLQFFSLLAILVGLETPLPVEGLWIRDGLTWAAVILTIYSGAGYLWLARGQIRDDLP